MHSQALDTLAALWRAAELPQDSLAHVTLSGEEPALPSSFRVGTAAQSTIAAAGLAAAEIWHARTSKRQHVSVDMHDAALECTGYFALDGRVPVPWGKLSGLYRCGADIGAPGWVRIHANFDHHRDGALALLELPPGNATERRNVEHALRTWRAEDLEQAAADAGMVIAALRSFDDWDRHPQAQAVAGLPLFSIEKIGDADPMPLKRVRRGALRPLQGVRVLDLTRILAGPICGRTLAAHGAEVMLVNAPHLPNIQSIVDTSRGKLSAHADLRSRDGHAALTTLLRRANVFVQGYRPGGLETLGFGPGQAAALRPGIVYVSLSAYGHVGPWADRRGFDSLVQTATGFNYAEAQAAGSERPKPMPVQMLDYASGFLMAFAAQAALLRQAAEGGSWHVRVSLAQTAHWLRGLGRLQASLPGPHVSIKDKLTPYESGFGSLMALPHAAELSETPAAWTRPSMPPGSHPPKWTS